MKVADASTIEKYIVHPEKKNFGWSAYFKEVKVIENPLLIKNATTYTIIIEGKKLSLFGKFIYDYQKNYENQ